MSYFCNVYLCKGRNTDGMGYCSEHTNPIRAKEAPFPQYLTRTMGEGLPLYGPGNNGEASFSDEDQGFDDINAELRNSGVSRCLACYFFVCKCASGLRDKNLLDDLTEEGYGHE